MAIQAETKDTTALSDAELTEMVELSGDEPVSFDIGALSKERDSWVLITQVRNGAPLQGFAFSTLERIGGTPSVLLGLAGVKPTTRRETVLRALMGDILRRAVLAFPDEDVLVGGRFVRHDGMEAFRTLTDVVPREGHRSSGEERAWGRRLAKRFSLPGAYADREFRHTGTGTRVPVVSYECLKPEKLTEHEPFFVDVDAERGDCVIGFGWAMAEDLAKLAD